MYAISLASTIRGRLFATLNKDSFVSKVNFFWNRCILIFFPSLGPVSPDRSRSLCLSSEKKKIGEQDANRRCIKDKFLATAQRKGKIKKELHIM